MTPLVNFATESLLCHIKHVDRLPEWFTSGRRNIAMDNIAAFDVTGDIAALDQLRPMAIDDLPRVMDHFYLWTPRSLQEDRQILLDAVFEMTAPEFDNIVHPEQNRDNIRKILKVIEGFHGTLSNLQILDFGCGSGLSGEVGAEFGLTLVGYDRCSTMRATAAKRGLKILTPERFATFPNNFFDAAFASYVFHFRPSPDDLRRLWELLRHGGLVIGNFHKDRGVSEVTSCFEAFGAETKIMDAQDTSYKHGSYRMYVR